jgi:hypothetical protein
VVSGFSRTNELIDAAARELTAGEPSPRLRHAVRSRLEQRPRAWHMPVWVPALAGAALLVIVAFGVTVADRPSDATAPAAPRVAVASPVVPPPVEPEPPKIASRSKPSNSSKFDPLVIEPLRLQAIAVGSSSGVMPIEIDDLRIEPLRIE